MTPKVTAGQLNQVKILFELEGELKLQAEGKQTATAPVQVSAQLLYDEKSVRVDDDHERITQSIRHYESARATIKFREGTVDPQLREARKIVAVAADTQDGVVLFSPLGPLDRDELDLINVPGNSVVIDTLLPRRAVAVGETWKLNSDWLAPLLGLDAVAGCDLECKLDRVDKNLAVVHVQGSVSGSAAGVASEMTVAAKYAFDTQLRHITWLAMSLKENRAIGHAHPGLAVTARVQMSLKKRTQVPALHNDVLADLNLKADEPSQLLEFRSPSGGFQMLLDRRWHVMIEREDVSVLRYVDRGELVAQCNISALPPLESGETFSIVDFQQDVQRALSDHFGEFVTASESVTDAGLHVMRVVTTGKIKELSIDWVYYHVTDNQGRRASCVFTYEAELAERFGAADQAVMSSFDFAARNEPARTEAASADAVRAANPKR